MHVPDTPQVDDPKDTSTAIEEQTPPRTTIASEEVTQAASTERRTVTAFDCMSYYWLCTTVRPSLNARCVPAKNLLPEWHSFSLHPQLYATLYSQKFVNPTPIQSLTIPKALSGRDVIGIAETVRFFIFFWVPCHTHFDV